MAVIPKTIWFFLPHRNVIRLQMLTQTTNLNCVASPGGERWGAWTSMPLQIQILWAGLRDTSHRTTMLTSEVVGVLSRSSRQVRLGEHGCEPSLPNTHLCALSGSAWNVVQSQQPLQCQLPPQITSDRFKLIPRKKDTLNAHGHAPPGFANALRGTHQNHDNVTEFKHRTRRHNGCLSQLWPS